MLGGGEARAQRAAGEEAKAFLLDALGEGPVAAKDVQAAARDAGIAIPTLRRTKSDMKVASKKLGKRRPWAWVRCTNGPGSARTPGPP